MISLQVLLSLLSLSIPVIPLSISFLIVFKLIAIYLLAVLYGHVKPLYPSVSESGATHPEAGLFSWFVTIEGFLIFVFSWLRFRQVIYVWTNTELNRSRRTNNSKLVLRANRIALKISSVTLVAMSAIGSFRATEHMEIQVLLGSMPAFISLSVYYSIQTWISYKSIAVINTLRIARLRLIVAIVASLLAFVNLISARVATLQAMTGGVTWTELRGDRKLWWSRSWSGYEAHLVSTVSENLFFLMLAFFSMTFVSEFKGFNLHNGEIKFVLGSLRYSSVTPTA